MKNLIVFDVNETMLDVGALDSQFERVFGNQFARLSWFSQVLQNSFVATITDSYHNFGEIAGAALEMIALRKGINLSVEDRNTILSGIRNLPPYPDVIPGLEKLRSAGFRLYTLTNSPPQVVEDQLQNAGIAGFFEQSLSVDTLRLFKPSAEVYQMAAEKLGVAIGQIRLVAAHDWDVAGAMLAGCSAAFISRPGMVLNPLMPTPDIVERDLIQVAEKIITKNG
jgi:2-haloacid dehalogenase